MQAGTTRTTARYIPLHTLCTRIGSDLCSVLPALYTLTGCDSTSKIGTKKAALEAGAVELLKEFGQSKSLSHTPRQKAEKFLVNVLRRNTDCSEFTSLRKEIYHTSTTATHTSLPPTTQGLHPHIDRAWYASYTMTHTLATEASAISPLDFGYHIKDGRLAPTTSWKLLDEKWTICCKCLKCARVTCPCRLKHVKCVEFCGCKATVSCKNPIV